MKGQSLKRQTAVMTASNVVIRGMGFFLRLITARLLGPEALGVMELANQAHMLVLTPAAAGLPGAVSRMVAQTDEKEGVLKAARQMALRLGLALGGCLLLLCPFLARWMGDERMLLSLLLYVPCIAIIGLSGVYRGYSLGRGNAWPPALCEWTEQGVRLATVLALAGLMPALTVGARAAVPALATVLGEGMGLAMIALWLRPSKKTKPLPVKKHLFRAALPITLNRLSHTLLRTGCSVLVPLRLCAAGLSHPEAISRMGMLNGMVMPLLFLPGMFTGALGTASIPAVAACREKKRRCRMMGRLLALAGAAGLGCTGLLYGLSPLIGQYVYGLPEVGSLLRCLCPMALLLSVQQVLGGILVGLGLQRKAFYASLLGAAFTLLFTFLWTASRGIAGAGQAHMLGHAVTVALGLWALFWHQKTADGTPSAACEPMEE